MTRRPDGCAAVRNALVRACVLTPSVGVHRSFPEGLYVGGGAEFSANSLACRWSALSFWSALGERE
jgi:hypothetical protein